MRVLPSRTQHHALYRTQKCVVLTPSSVGSSTRRRSIDRRTHKMRPSVRGFSYVVVLISSRWLPHPETNWERSSLENSKKRVFHSGTLFTKKFSKIQCLVPTLSDLVLILVCVKSCFCDKFLTVRVNSR